MQKERRTKIEAVKALEYIVASGDIKIYEADQLRGLYIIKPKRDICMLDTNEKTFQRKTNLTNT